MPSHSVKCLILYILMLISNEGIAQKQNPSFIYKNSILSYTITRYSPAWEIQPATEENTDIDSGSKLFRQIRADETEALSSMMYKNVPKALRSLNSIDLIDHWKRNRVRMYYRIRYKGYNVFIARLNDHSSRSILPFKDQEGKWILDTDFMKDPLFSCLQDVNFDPFSGSFLGNTLANITFEQEDNGHFSDYSGNDNHVVNNGADVTIGRIGKCVKVKTSNELSVPAGGIDISHDFHIDAHFNVAKNSVGSEPLIVLSANTNDGSSKVEIQVQNKSNGDSEFLVKYFDNGVLKQISSIIPTGRWFHYNLSSRNKILSVTVDGNEVVSASVKRPDKSVVSTFEFGGAGSAEYLLDELHIGL